MIRDNPMIKQKDIIDQTSISRAQVVTDFMSCH